MVGVIVTGGARVKSIHNVCQKMLFPPSLFDNECFWPESASGGP